MLFGIFTQKPQTLLGLDIGTSSVKIVEVTRQGNKVILSNYGESFASKLDRAVHSSVLKIRNSEVIQQITQILQATGINTRDVVLSVPVFSSFSTILELPRMPKPELEQAVISEARRYIPIPLAEIQFDWVELSMLSTEDIVKVLAVAVPNDVINTYSVIVKKAGLDLRETELETFSSARALTGENPDAAVIIDIGSRSTNISVSERGMVSVHHNIDTSGLSFSKAIERGLGIDLMRAEEMKHTRGLQGSSQVRDILTSLMDTIVIDVQRIVQDYKRKGGSSPSAIILIGGSAHLPGILQYFEQSLSIPTHIGDPFRELQYPIALQDVLKKIGPSFAVAAGLALRKI